MLHPAEQPIVCTPLTLPCGAKQVQISLEPPTTFDPQSRTLISIHLMLAAEPQHCRGLTLLHLWVELATKRKVCSGRVCLGPHELQCYNISRQEPIGQD